MKIKNLFIGGTSNTFIQFFRSLFVGGIATVVDMLVLILVREAFHVPEGVAAIFGFIIGLAVNYVICSFWVFAKAKVKNRLTDFIGFAVIGIIGLGLTQLIIDPFAVDGMFGKGAFVQWEIFGGLIPTNKYYIVGKIIAVVVVYMWNFFARKFILYRKCEVEEGSPEEAALKEKREKQAKKKAEKKAKAKAEKKKKAKKAAKQKKAEKKAQADKKAREEAVRRNTK